MNSNSNRKLKKVSSLPELYDIQSPSPLKAKLKFDKNSLAKLLNDIKYFNSTKSKLDSNNSRIYNNYRFNFSKPKTASKNYRYYYGENMVYDNESHITKNSNIKNKMNQTNNRPVWNYSYYYNERKKKNDKCYKLLKNNHSYKKMRIRNVFNFKNPYIEDWKKPRMIRILEQNSLIKEEIMLKPWEFFSNNDNF